MPARKRQWNAKESTQRGGEAAPGQTYSVFAARTAARAASIEADMCSSVRGGGAVRRAATTSLHGGTLRFIPSSSRSFCDNHHQAVGDAGI
eukprot:5297830-Prymnesium_polylepis.1